MARKFLNGVDLNNKVLSNLADGAAATDGVNLQQLQAAIRGLDWKASARVASTTNINLASPGATINGVTMATNDRFLAKDQSTGSQNGIYVWNGAASAATRATDADASAEVSSGMAVPVTEGSVDPDVTWVLGTNDPITLDTTALVFAKLGGGGGTYTADGQGIEVSANQFSLELDPTGSTLSKSASGLRVATGYATALAGGGLTESAGVLAVGAGTGISVAADAVSVDVSIVARKFAANCVATTNPQTFTHNLNTLDVHVTVVEVSSGNHMLTDVTASGVNTVSVNFGGAPTAAQYRVVVIG